VGDFLLDRQYELSREAEALYRKGDCANSAITCIIATESLF